MKGYIVKLAACVSVCVYLYFYWSFVLSPVLQFCDISLIRQATMKERYIEAFIIKKKKKGTRLKPTNIKNRNKWICCELRPFIEKPSSSINNFYLFIFKLKYAYIENKLLIPNITLLVFVFNEKMKKKDYLDNLLLHGFFPF